MTLYLGKRDAWSPYHLTPSVLRAWWSARDHGTPLMTDDGAGLISNWVDRMNGLAVTATTTARPTWGATSFNTTFPGVTFDGVAMCLTTITLAGLPTGAVAGNLIFVCSFPGPPIANSRIINYGTAVGTTRQVFNSSSAIDGTPKASDGTTSTTTPTGLIIPQIEIAEFVGTTINLWRNGTLIGSPATAATLNTGTARLRIGANVNGTAGSFSNTLIADAMVTTLLTAPQRAQLEGFTAWQYGFVASLPASHPYKSAPP